MQVRPGRPPTPPHPPAPPTPPVIDPDPIRQPPLSDAGGRIRGRQGVTRGVTQHAFNGHVPRLLLGDERLWRDAIHRE